MAKSLFATLKIPLLFPLLSLALILTGCATKIPSVIREPPPGNPSLAEVRQAPERFEGSQVRWGGTIAEVQNRPEETWLEVVARPLEGSGRPRDTDQSHGRFIARIGGFLDPEIYTRGRELTVTGRIAGLERRAIGEYSYAFPLVDVEAYYLWEIPTRPYYYGPDRFWYDPWYYYDPWLRYPYPYPWPYRPYW